MINHMIIDFGSISYWQLFSIAAKNKDKYPSFNRNTIMKMESDADFPDWKAGVDYCILDLIDNMNPDIVTIACDGKKLWRRDIYSDYKANRKKNRAEIPINWDRFYEIRNEYLSKISEVLPVKVIYVDNAEADDIIAVLTKELNQEQNITAITVDSDIHQLFKYKNFKCYDPRKRAYMSLRDPSEALLVKIMSGDTSDNIKPLRPRLGPATATKIINECNGDVTNYCKDNGLLESLQLNQKLINFEFIPYEICADIMKAYSNTKIEKMNSLKNISYYGDAYSSFLRVSKGNLFDNQKP